MTTESHPPAPRAAVPRRTVLATGAGLAATATTGGGVLLAEEAAALSPAARRMFRHGVASGDPRPRRVVLWTRVTPTPRATPGSGRGPRVRVQWQVARDARFRRIVRRGTVATGPGRDHTVKVDAGRLQPGTRYHYRFVVVRVGGRRTRVVGPAGRTRTAPARAATPDHLRLGVVSCANWQAGWFSAYRHLADRPDLDAVLHLGDYLYEYAPGEYGYGQSNETIRPHDPPREMVSLADYRRRHGQYKTDPDLRRLHATHPFIVTWDDHEVTNDAWRAGAENHDPAEGDYLARRARAQRAFDEWMPVRMGRRAATGDGTRLFRRLRFGRLAELSLLDLRTHRSQQVDTLAPSPVPSLQAQVSDPDRTITGRRQMQWLKDSLRRGGPQWKLVGNPVMIAPVTFAQVPQDLVGPVNDVTGLLPDDGFPYNVDQWDGYTADRREILDHVRDHGLRDVVFLTGDIHSGWACDLPYDASTYPVGDSAGVELVCSSVTSNNLKDITGSPPRTTSLAVETTIQANNRHVKYLNFDDHGFSVLDVTPERTQMDWFVISDRKDRGASASWTASWATRSGTNTVHPVDRPVAP